MNNLRPPIEVFSKLLEERPLFKKLSLTLMVFSLLFLAIEGALGQKTDSAIEKRRPLSPEGAISSVERQLPPLQNPQQPVNCEIAGRYIDDAIARAVLTQETYLLDLLAVIHPGPGETSPSLSEMRLLQVKAYFEYVRFSKYVVATGERVKGEGRIELYVNGRLLYSLPLLRKRGINLLSCVAV